MKRFINAGKQLMARGYAKAAAVGTGMTVMAGQASAAVPANVTTALGDALTDATTVAGLALIIVVGVAAFKYMKSAVR